jgi:hypothetical protein
MTRMTRALRSRTAAVATAAGAAAVLTATLVQAQPAAAQPPAAAKPAAVRPSTDAAHALAHCDSSTITVRPNQGEIAFTDLPARITVASPMQVKVEVTADVGVPAGSELRLTYVTNEGTLDEGRVGPANFANHQEFFETRTTFALINVNAGTSILWPRVRLSGPAGATATLLHRCISVEPIEPPLTG